MCEFLLCYLNEFVVVFAEHGKIDVIIPWDEPFVSYSTQ